MRMRLLLFALAVCFNCLCGGAVAFAAGLPIVGGAVAANIVATLAPAVTGLRAGLYTEIWTGATIKAFRDSLESIAWLNRITAYDSAVAANNTINFVDLGGDPEVLINNTTYPIEVSSIADLNKSISLNKYQTTATKVTDDEVRGLSYDKKSTVIERHRESVHQKKIAQAIHSIAPATSGVKTPVLFTSGSLDASAPSGTRVPFTFKDVIKLKAAFDKQNVPLEGRVLVLASEHVQDLLSENNQVFFNQYYNTSTGKIANAFGFDIYEYTSNPYYTSTGTKVAFDAIPGATDGVASVAFHTSRVMKATGETKVYIDEPNPTTQEWLYNLRHYFVCLPLKEEAIGAIVSAYKS